MDAIHYIVHCLWWEKDRNIVLEIDDKTQLNVLLLAEFLYFFDKYKYSLLRIDMKTKVVQHVTRGLMINAFDV